jgi:membrane associated rhomboid family serine protease
MIPLRDDGRPLRPPIVTAIIMAICIVVFIWELTLTAPARDAVFLGLGLIPAVVTGEATLAHGIWSVTPTLTILTSLFLHGGWLHIGGNLLYLWIFGRSVEDRVGHLRYLLLYLVAGLAAALTQIATDPTSAIPVIGASGAISGVLGAYLVLFPYARVLVLVPISCMFFHYIRARWLLGFWFVLQLVTALLRIETGVALWAHIGGFLVGMGFALPMRRRLRRSRGPWD